MYDLPFDYYDLILDEEKIKDMQVLLSPVISEEAKNKAEQIVKDYNPTAEVAYSNLNGLE